MSSKFSRRAALVAAPLTLTSALAAGCGTTTKANTTASSAKPAANPMAMHGMAPLAGGADGLKTTAAGLTLAPATTRIPKGSTKTWSFKVLDANGRPVTKFQRDQTKLVHLIVTKRDFSAYQHIHPVLAPDGTFSIPLTLTSPGSYRAIADFTTAGKRHVLGTDLKVPGTTTTKALPATAPTATVDGYTVRLTHPPLKAGKESELSYTITRNAKPVTDLQPYLGAYGHLVALRKPDLAYSHVHPTSSDRAKGTIRFATELPTQAPYRLFLQFQTNGKVHTAAFTLKVAS